MKSLFFFAAVTLAALFPTEGLARTNAGCLQKQLATAVQGSKMMVRCYGQAQRRDEPVDHECLSRATRRMRVTYSRAEASGCPPVDNAEQIISETIGFMNQLTDLLLAGSGSDEAKPEASAAAATPTPSAR